MRTNISDLLVNPATPIKTALKKVSEGGDKILIVVSQNKELLGVLTDGDLRRWILHCGGIKGEVTDCFNRNPLIANEHFIPEDARKQMLEHKIECLPVVSNKNHVIGLIRWDDVFKEGDTNKPTIDYPVIIMAGGKGTRLDPFTKVLPKPLIPINDKPVIEIIMSKFAEYGIKDFYLSVNHKSKILKAYFEETDFDYNIHFIEENMPLGTAGSLKLLEGKIESSMLVTNCDVIIKSNYAEIVEFHKKTHSDISIVGAMRHFTIPYGVCKIENGGKLLEITEKPEYDFLVNTGMYIVKPNILSLIPEGKMFHFTDLIEAVQKRKGVTTVFPVEESAWLDVGQWEEYKRVQQVMQKSV